MTTKSRYRAALPLALTLVLAACGQQAATPAEKAEANEAEAEGAVHLTAEQIAAAGIVLVRPTAGAGVLSLPATIESDPQATQVVSAAIGGRVVALNRNLGEGVRRGEVVAVIESRDAAGLRAEVEAAQARANLARSNLARRRARRSTGPAIRAARRSGCGATASANSRPARCSSSSCWCSPPV